MSSKIRIGADTSDAKKNILDLGKTVKQLGGSKIQIFSNEEKKFIRTEMNREIKAMGANLNRNKQMIGDLVKEQQKMVVGSKEELKHRDKILKAYRTQSKLAKQIKDTEKAKSSVSPQGGVGSDIGKIFSKYAKTLAVIGLAAGAVGIPLGVTSAKQFMGGAADRTKLSGLGVNENTGINGNRLARAGLTEQEFNQRRVSGVGALGAQGGSAQSILQQAEFERSRGLQGGTMLNTATSLRGQFGGQGADQAQAELQASIMASGMESALGPYLEAMTGLLGEINENGVSNTTEMIAAMGELVTNGARTPEYLAKAFTNINQSVKGSSGEANAFLQTSFARQGIGGKTIGGTRFALESGGITGLNKKQLSKRGYNDELLENMSGSGMFSGSGKRTGAILEQFKQSAGMSKGSNVNDVTDINQMIKLSNLANNILGTKGIGGFDSLKIFEDMKNNPNSKRDFDQELKDIKSKNEPQLTRLDKINTTLAGQTELLLAIKTNTRENIGRESSAVGNALIRLQNVGEKAQGEQVKMGSKGLASGVNATASVADYMTGGLGEDVYDGYSSAKDWVSDLFGMDDKMKYRTDISKNPSKTSSNTESDAQQILQSIDKTLKTKLKDQKTQFNNKTNIKIQLGNGKVIDRTNN